VLARGAFLVAQRPDLSLAALGMRGVFLRLPPACAVAAAMTSDPSCASRCEE